MTCNSTKDIDWCIWWNPHGKPCQFYRNRKANCPIVFAGSKASVNSNQLDSKSCNVNISNSEFGSTEGSKWTCTIGTTDDISDPSTWTHTNKTATLTLKELLSTSESNKSDTVRFSSDGVFQIIGVSAVRYLVYFWYVRKFYN